MTKRSSVLLVSSDPELHRTLEIITSTYNLRCLGAENAKTGIRLLASNKPDCVIFDLEILHTQRHKIFAKKKLQESGIPALLLNDNGNSGIQEGNRTNTPLKIEPIVKFIMGNCNRKPGNSNGGFLTRLFSRLKLRRA